MNSESINHTYIIVGNKPWNRRVFEKIISKSPSQWHFIGCHEQLTLEIVQTLSPRYIFFLHWSWKVPDKIVNNYECVFLYDHVPYGRGGSPLRDSIVRGHLHTKLTALEWAFGQFQSTFRPDAFMDISATLETKLRAMALYESEARSFPHPRSPQALQATARRWGSVVGVEAAEAFELIRFIR